MAISRIRLGITATAPVSAATVVAPVSTATVVAPVSTATVVAPVSTATVVVPVYTATVVVPVSAVSWINIVMGAEVDYLGRNPVVREISLVTDASNWNLGKAPKDIAWGTDASDLLIFKALPEVVLMADAQQYSLHRTLNDLVDATDDFYGLMDADDQQVTHFSKTVSTDYLGHQDLASKHSNKGIVDLASTSETLGYAAEKAVSDLGVSSDKSLVAMGKSGADLVTSVEAQTRFVGKHSEDTVTAFEAIRNHLVKVLSDQVATSEYVQRGLGIQRNDLAAITDDPLVVFYPGTGIPQQFELQQAVDLYAASLVKHIRDVCDINDAAFVAYIKPFIDSVATADTRSISLSRPHSDLAVSADTGNVICTNYCNSRYFAQPYVGAGHSF